MRVFVAVVLIMLLVPVVAQADIVYHGEIDNINDPVWGATEGSAGYNLWDYDYEITGGFNRFTTPRWGIACPVRPVSWVAPTGWNAQWYEIIPHWDTYGLTDIEGESGMVWSVSGSGQVLTGFHFQTAPQFYPVQQPYNGDSWNSDTEYSANPEPCSMVLMGLLMAGGTFWRRRRTTQAQQASSMI